MSNIKIIFSRFHWVRILLSLLLIMAITIPEAYARDSCSSNAQCSSGQQCRNYSRSVTQDCWLGGLFCDAIVLYSLRCTNRCTNNSQCQTRETCTGPRGNKFCTRL